RLERPAGAEASLRHVLSVEPHFVEATYHLVRLLIDQGRYSEAVAALETATAPVADGRGPNRAGGLAHFAVELAQRGVEDAVPRMQTMVAQIPDGIVANCQLGDALTAIGDKVAATPYFERAASGQPAGEDKWQWLYKSISLFRLERPAGAEASLRH